MPSCSVSFNNDRAHYISESVYTLGTLSCAVCGQAFPINSSSRVPMSCEACGTLHQASETSASHVPPVPLSSTSSLYAAARLLTQDTIDVLMLHALRSIDANVDESLHEGASGEATARSLAQGKTQVGITEIDNRVIEEALCESCGMHRPCKTFARQTRGADEGQTIFFQCTVCKSEWQQNS